jgi:hypothetical protein
MLHHVELWVADLECGKSQWGWLPGELGYQQFQDWPAGRSWAVRRDLPGHRAVSLHVSR